MADVKRLRVDGREDLYWTVSQAAEAYGCSRHKIDYLIRKRVLDCHTLLGRRVVLAEDVMVLVELKQARQVSQYPMEDGDGDYL